MWVKYFLNFSVGVSEEDLRKAEQSLRDEMESEKMMLVSCNFSHTLLQGIKKVFQLQVSCH